MNGGMKKIVGIKKRKDIEVRDEERTIPYQNLRDSNQVG